MFQRCGNRIRGEGGKWQIGGYGGMIRGVGGLGGYLRCKTWR